MTVNLLSEEVAPTRRPGQCSECDGPRKARGLCQKHYDKLRRSGGLERANRTRTDVLKRDALGNKLCIECREWIPVADYSSNTSRKDGLSPYCRPCVKAAWVDRERDRKYGLAPGSVRKIFCEHGYMCAICGCLIDDSAHVDHDHECCGNRGRACGNCVRGVLCKPCNTLLGNANDSVETLISAVAYLLNWGK